MADDFAAVESKVQGLQAACAELNRARDEALGTQKDLRNELKTMQQTVHSTFRQEASTSQNILGAAASRLDVEAVMRMNEAKSDSKVGSRFFIS